jgi:hypothetical protein
MKPHNLQVKDHPRLVAGLGLALSLLLLWKTFPTLGKVWLDSESSRLIALPYQADSSPASEHFTVSLTLNVTALTQRTYRFYTDDCVESVFVNGSPLSLETISPTTRCDYRNGIALDLSALLRNGTNVISLHGQDRGGKFGFDLRPSFWDLRLAILTALAFFSFFGFLSAMSERSGLPRICRGLLAGALIINLTYFVVTPSYERAHDYDGHLDHILKVASGSWLTKTDACWQCHHPPLYYWGAATLTGFPSQLGTRELFLLQVATLFLYLAFVFVGLLLLYRASGNSRFAGGAGALLAWWPGGVFLSSRLSNDVPYYFLTALGLYHFFEWQRRRNSLSLSLAVVAALAALFTKTNGLVLVGILFLFLAWDCRRKITRAPTIAMAGLAFGLIAMKMMLAYKGKPVDRLHQLDGGLAVHSQIWNFIYVNVIDFVKYPFTNCWVDTLGRQSFWAFMLKTSLFGEYTFESLPLYIAGVVTNLSLLGILGVVTYGLLEQRKIKTPANLLLGAFFVLGITALAAFRFKVPFACANDFRYIYPVVIPGAFYFMKGLEKLSQRSTPVPLWMANFSMGLFLTGTIVFFGLLSAGYA